MKTCPCGKLCYNSKTAATTAIRRLQGFGCKAKRAYFDGKCLHWHITSYSSYYNGIDTDFLEGEGEGSGVKEKKSEKKPAHYNKGKSNPTGKGGGCSWRGWL